jgi:hypothetical protein
MMNYLQEAILKCVDDEPECPDEPPEEMIEALQTAIMNNDIDLLIECLRITVRLTKEGIAERIKTFFKEGNETGAL